MPNQKVYLAKLSLEVSQLWFSILTEAITGIFFHQKIMMEIPGDRAKISRFAFSRHLEIDENPLHTYN